MSKRLRGSLAILLATVIWGSTFVAQSVGVEHVGPFTFLSFRSTLAVLALLLFLFIRKPKKFLPTLANPKLWKAGIPCGISLFVATGLQQLGLIDVDPGKAGFITSMYILLVPIIGLFLKKKPPKIIWISIVIATIGLYLLSCADINSIAVGDLLLLGCAVAFAVQILIVDHVAGDLDSIALNMVQALICAIISGIVMLFSEKLVAADILSCWFPLCWAGVFSMGIAYTLQIIGQKSIEPNTASLLMSFESVFAAISGWLILNETFTLWEGIGCFLVFSAIILSQIPFKTPKKAPR